MAVNLIHSSIDFINGHQLFEPDDATRQQLGLVHKTRPLIRTGYEWDEDAKNCITVVLRPRRTRLEFEFHAHPVPPNERLTTKARQAIESMPAVYELLDNLSSVTKTALSTNIHYRFPPGTRRAIISLPFLKMSVPGLPFSEIAGVRFVQGSTSVILDLHEGNVLHVSVTFQHPEAISRDILRRIIDRGNTILSGFMVPEKPENVR